MRRLLLSAIALALAVLPAAAGPRAVVELFTSQGCSSCPPADRLMVDWARRPDIVALSMPVDYWDYLGWRDTLAVHAFALRQRAYAEGRGDRDVFTPQVVVNGREDRVGSDGKAVEAAIGAGAGLTVPVAVSTSPGGHIVALGPGGAPGAIVIVPVQSSARVVIDRGENSGATVTYANVARAIRPVGHYDGSLMTVTLDHDAVAAPGADAFAVLVQQEDAGRPGPIEGAAFVPAGAH